MKTTFSIIALCLLMFATQAQTSSGGAPLPPQIDTNALAQIRSNALAFIATNIPVVIPMVTNVIQTFPMFYPAGIPHGANMMTSHDDVHWCVGQYFDITKTNFLSFTNPANSTNFWMIVLMPPQIISISNSFTPTNSVSTTN